MKWTVHIDGGPRRVNHAAVCIEDEIFSFGGCCLTDENNDWEPISVHVLDTNTLRWSTVNYKNSEIDPFQRYGHSVVAYGCKVYMWGGRNNEVACITLFCFDTKKLEWSKPQVTGTIPFAKDGHTACLIKNKMYIFGGYESLTDQYSQEVHCLDLDTMNWNLIKTTGRAPSPRDFQTAVAIADKMYVYGGRGDVNSPYDTDEDYYCHKLYYLDTINKKWCTLRPSGTLPQGRRSHSAWCYNGYMYIFGGFNSRTNTHYNDLWRYSIKNNSWKVLNVSGHVPSKRRRQACEIYKDKVYLFGGSSPCPHQEPDENQERLIDNNDLYVLDYAPSLKTLCILIVLENNLDQSCLPHHILSDIRIMTISNKISRPLNQSG